MTTCRYCVYCHHGLCNCPFAKKFAEKINDENEACICYLEYDSFQK